MLRFLLILIIIPVFTFAKANSIRRVHSHRLIHDYYSAIDECKLGIQEEPFQRELHFALIQSLAESGSDEEAMKHWKKVSEYFQYEDQNFTLLETIAWSVLEKCESAAQLQVNMASMMGAFYTQDVRAVKMLTKQLHSSNAFIRAMAVQLAAKYRDQTLIEEIKEMLPKEKVWYVQLEVIQALGSMQVKEMSDSLKEIIASTRSTIEQKQVATSSLVSMYRHLEKKELDVLLKSNRASLRALACNIIAYLDLSEYVDSLTHLLSDSSFEVRISALNTLGLLEITFDQALREKILTLTRDSHSVISISAAFLALRFEAKIGQDVLMKWVFCSDPETRRLAASAIAKSGHYGESLSRSILRTSVDSYVKANIAFGLIGQELDLNLACVTLYQFLESEKKLMMWDRSKHPIFSSIAPSDVRHVPQMPEYPKMVDHHTRLDILNLLVIKRYCRAEKLIKEFLRNHISGISYAASTTLLEEGES
ncbi:MAG: HEAT repeat domain-containing protein, partial [Simkaniaceae bacterium]|nr:HEAT repeat domain-containing protein [Simkaniaceae bacterium]